MQALTQVDAAYVQSLIPDAETCDHVLSYLLEFEELWGPSKAYFVGEVESGGWCVVAWYGDSLMVHPVNVSEEVRAKLPHSFGLPVDSLTIARGEALEVLALKGRERLTLRATGANRDKLKAFCWELMFAAS